MAAAARPFPALGDGLRYGAAAGLTAWGADFLARFASAVGSRQVPWSAYDQSALALELCLAGLTALAGSLLACLLFAAGRPLLRRLPSSGGTSLRERVPAWMMVETSALVVLVLALLGRNLSTRQFLIALVSAAVLAFLFSWPLARRRSRLLAWAGVLLPLLGLGLAVLGWLLRVLLAPDVWTSPAPAASAPAADAPDILLMTLDTTRADRLGCYGNERARTPNLDRLASTGVRYEHAYAPTSCTQPSHASMLTGLQMPWHGVRRNNETALDPEVPTVPALLAAAGYETRAVVSAYPLDRQFGFTRGFDYYDDRMPVNFAFGHAQRRFQQFLVRRSVGYRLMQTLRLLELVSESVEICRAAGQTRGAALEALQGAPADRPLLLWVHWWDPHGPYAPPAAYYQPYPAEPNPDRSRCRFRWGTYSSYAEVLAHYDGEIAYMDHELGAVLDAFRARQRPQVVFVTADHGEGLHEHGVATHGSDVFDATLHVPLLISGSGVPQGAVVPETVANYDLAATMLQLAGVALPADLAARPLEPFDASAPAAAADRSYYHEATQALHRDGTRDLNRAWRAEGWKYLNLVQNPGAAEPSAPDGLEALYHYAEDPGEAQDQRSAQAGLVARMLEALQRYSATFPAGRGAALGANAERDSNMEELGYGGGADEEPDGEAPLKRP